MRGEERVEGAVDRNGGEDRQEHRRKQRNEAEDPGDAEMQSCARLPLPGFQKLGDLKPDDADDRENQGSVDAERPEIDVVRRNDPGSVRPFRIRKVATLDRSAATTTLTLIQKAEGLTKASAALKRCPAFARPLVNCALKPAVTSSLPPCCRAASVAAEFGEIVANPPRFVVTWCVRRVSNHPKLNDPSSFATPVEAKSRK